MSDKEYLLLVQESQKTQSILLFYSRVFNLCENKIWIVDRFGKYYLFAEWTKVRFNIRVKKFSRKDAWVN